MLADRCSGCLKSQGLGNLYVNLKGGVMNQVDSIKHLAEQLSQLLEGEGFAQRPWFRRGDLAVCCWYREKEWSEDRVELSYRPKYPVTVDLGFGVYLPCRSEEKVMLDARMLGFILDKDRTYAIPKAFAGLRLASFARTVAKDVTQALPWFDQYSEPEKALDKLRRGLTNHGHSDTRPVRDLTNFLQRLSS